MNPLRNFKKLKRGYTFGVPTFYNNFHTGLDLIVPVGTPLYAPFNGTASKSYGPQGGNRIDFKVDNGDVIRFLHLSKYGKIGVVKEGELIGYSGNSGVVTNTPHVHMDTTVNGKLVDPDKYNFMDLLKLLCVNFPPSLITEIKQEVEKYSRGDLTPVLTNIDNPINVPVGMLTQDQAYKIVDGLAPSKFNIFFYKGNATSAFSASYYYPKRNSCVTTIPLPGDARLLAFEIAHQMTFWYNENRGTNPVIPNPDSNYPTDELIYSKYDSIKPYLSIILGQVGEDMYELIEHPTRKGELYALKNKVVRHISNRQTLLLGAKPLDQQWQFIDGQTTVRKVTQVEWDSFTVTDEFHLDPMD